MWIEVHKNGARLSRYTYKYVVPPDPARPGRLQPHVLSQCTYRCVVLPDPRLVYYRNVHTVSMHLQVRGAP